MITYDVEERRDVCEECRHAPHERGTDLGDVVAVATHCKKSGKESGVCVIVVLVMNAVE